MASEDRDLKVAKAARALVQRLWAGGERKRALDEATKAKLPLKEWPEGLAGFKQLIESNG